MTSRVADLKNFDVNIIGNKSRLNAFLKIVRADERFFCEEYITKENQYCLRFEVRGSDNVQYGFNVLMGEEIPLFEPDGWTIILGSEYSEYCEALSERYMLKRFIVYIEGEEVDSSLRYYDRCYNTANPIILITEMLRYLTQNSNITLSSCPISYYQRIGNGVLNPRVNNI